MLEGVEPFSIGVNEVINEVRAFMRSQTEELQKLKAAIEQLTASSKNLHYEVECMRSEFSEYFERSKASAQQTGAGIGAHWSAIKRSPTAGFSHPPQPCELISKGLSSSVHRINNPLPESNQATIGDGAPSQLSVLSGLLPPADKLATLPTEQTISTKSLLKSPPPTSPFGLPCTSYYPPPPIPLFTKASAPQPSKPAPPMPAWKKRVMELHGHELKKADEGYGVKEYRELLAKQVDPNFDPVQYAVEKSRGQYYAKHFDFSRYSQPPKNESKTGIMNKLIGWLPGLLFNSSCCVPK
jgi:hypothetical protein